MKKALLLVVVSAIMVIRANGEEGPDVPKGFVALFKGKDLSGWQASDGKNELWKVEDGLLKPDRDMGKKGAARLETTRKYKDFTLLVDFRLHEKGSNSGVIIGNPPAAFQMEITIRGAGVIDGYRFGTKYSDALKAACDAAKKLGAGKPLGEWNTYGITMRGKKLSVKLNGQTCIDGIEVDFVPLQRSIALQRFPGGPGSNWNAKVDFRNIFIKELGPEG